MSKINLTIVLPVFNEEAVIEEFYNRTHQVLTTMVDVKSTLLFVVDKCTDNTLEVLRRIAKKDSSVKVIALSSRFGHQMSLMAGIEHSLNADAIVMMDSDLQHPPELIPTLVDNFRQGYDIVYTKRNDTEDVGFIRKSVGNAFYRIINRLSNVALNANSADFRLISGHIANLFTTDIRERNLFLRGLFSWVGFRQIGVEYKAEKRFAGESKYSLSKMIQLATAGIISFSTKPLQIGIFVGVIFATVALLLLIVALARFFIIQSLPSGFTTLVVLLLFFSAIQLIFLGIVGSYIGGIYEEVKNRPRYIIEEVI